MTHLVQPAAKTIANEPFGLTPQDLVHASNTLSSSPPGRGEISSIFLRSKYIRAAIQGGTIRSCTMGQCSSVRNRTHRLGLHDGYFSMEFLSRNSRGDHDGIALGEDHTPNPERVLIHVDLCPVRVVWAQETAERKANNSNNKGPRGGSRTVDPRARISSPYYTCYNPSLSASHQNVRCSQRDQERKRSRNTKLKGRTLGAEHTEDHDRGHGLRIKEMLFKTNSREKPTPCPLRQQPIETRSSLAGTSKQEIKSPSSWNSL